MPSIITIQTLIKWAKQQLKNVESAALDAELLLAHVLKLKRVQLYTQSLQEITSTQQAQFEDLIARRCAGEPVAYLVGYREFWSLPLEVTPDVLIPRPETEGIIELLLQKLPAHKYCKVADLGTGSGAIALALASERPNWSIVATDKHNAALMIAARNAKLLKITNIEFRQGEWCAALNGEMFSAIVSNPPYIAQDDEHLRSKELQYEPQTALVASQQGLADLEQIIQQARSHLITDGWLILEHGYQQSAAVKKMLEKYSYSAITDQPDLVGIARFAVAQAR